MLGSILAYMRLDAPINDLESIPREKENARFQLQPIGQSVRWVENGVLYYNGQIVEGSFGLLNRITVKTKTSEELPF